LWNGDDAVHPQFAVNFDSRFSSREAAKNAKKNACGCTLIMGDERRPSFT
jgi:hypothetical protein